MLLPMRYTLTLLGLVGLLLWGCAGNENATPISTTAPAAADSAQLALFAQQLPLLDSMMNAQQYPDLRKRLIRYANTVLREQVSSAADINRVFDERSYLLTLLHDKVFNPFFSKQDYLDLYNSEKGSQLEKELNRIGMSTSSAEGIYTGLQPSSMLDEAIQQYGSPDFQLYSQLIVQRGMTMSGEYPYGRTEPYIAIAWLGEQLHTQYPNSKYTQQIASDFRYALNTLLDVHQVGSPANGYICVAHDLKTEAYPCMISCDAPKQFANAHPNSRYAATARSIAANLSDIPMSDDNQQPLPVYAVIAQWAGKASDYETDTTLSADRAAEQLLNGFLDKGIDLPHLLRVYYQGELQNALCYRFYGQPSKAQKALSVFQKTVPQAAGIFKLLYNPTEGTWVATKP